MEAAEHKIKITVDTGGADTSARLRRQFATLDQQLTRDVVSRMRGGGGSVLGALMGLTSTRVAGMPAGGQSAQQSAIGRALRDLVNQPGAMGLVGGGGGDSGMISRLLGARASSDRSNALAAALSTAGSPDQSFLAKLAGAAGPGFGALGPKGALLAAGIPVALGALPALAGVGATAGVGALGAGVIGLGAKTLIGTKKDQGPLYAQAQQVAEVFENTMKQAAGPMLRPLQQAFGQIPKILKGLLPDLKALFAGAATLIQPLLRGVTDIAHMVLPGLAAAFRAVAPSIRPLLDGLGMLVRNIFPGLNVLLKATAPFMGQFARALGGLGAGLGRMFAVMAPAVGPSMRILSAILHVVGSLLPVIGKLAAIFATALAPVIVAFGKAIEIIEPPLIIVGKILAGLASAILGDLISVLIAVAKLIAGLAPSFTILAGVLSTVFNALESAGVFGALSSALEQLAPLLAQLINLIVAQLVPILPTLITLFVQVSTIMIDLVAAGLGTLVKLVASLLQHLPFLVPVLAAVTAAWLAWNLIAAVSPLGWIVIGIVAVVGAITLLATHWGRVWSDIKNWAHDAWEFLTHGWGQILIPQLYLIRKVVEFVRDHWKQAWTDIRNWAVDAWQGIYNEVIAPIARFFLHIIPGWWDAAVGFARNRLWEPLKNGFIAAWHWIYDNVVNPIKVAWTQTIPGWFSTAVDAVKRIWGKIEGFIATPVAWVVNNIIDRLIGIFNSITNAVGLGKPLTPVTIKAARGGRLPGWGGGDVLPALLEPGETVVSKEDSRHPAMLAAFHAAGVPGYQTGALVHGIPLAGGPVLGNKGATTGHGPGLLGGALDIGKILLALFTGNTAAAANAITALLGGGAGGAAGELGKMLAAIPVRLVKDIASFFVRNVGSGMFVPNAIIKFAESFIGKVPYLWGGTSPAGWDCSGFVDYVYQHFGLNPPRTSQQQFNWVQRTQAPVPGGLAFFAGGDGTQASPGHVGIVIGPNRMVDAYATGFGTRLDYIQGSSGAISGYGVPPRGLGVAGAMPGAGKVIANIQAAMAATMAPAAWLPLLETLVQKESGGNQYAVNPIAVGGEHAEGPYQMLPSTFAAFATVPGGIFNWLAEGVAAIRYIESRYGSPANIPGIGKPGAYRGYDGGGWLMPGATLALNGTGQAEGVLTPGQLLALSQGSVADAIREMHADLAALLEWLPGATGDVVGGTLNDMAAGAVRRAHYGAR